MRLHKPKPPTKGAHRVRLLGRLDGIPIGIKDTLAVKGQPCAVHQNARELCLSL